MQMSNSEPDSRADGSARSDERASREASCPLCLASDIKQIDAVPVADLVELFEKSYKVDVKKEFGSMDTVLYYFCNDCDLRFFYPFVTGSESFYEGLQKFDFYYMSEKEEYVFAKDFIKSTDRLLEIGAGKGAFAKKTGTRDYTGLEFSSKAIEAASGEGISLLRESIQEHSKRNKERYDIVCAFQVLEHISDIRSFINSSVECLKPGGKLIFSVPSYNSFLSLAKNVILNMPPHHISHWSYKSLNNIARYFPLEMVAVYHEPLAAVHKTFFSAVFSAYIVDRIFCRRKKLMDTSMKPKIMMGFTVLLYHVIYAVLHIASYINLLPRGHSVTCVYKKTN